MPGNLAVATVSPVIVFPNSLSTSFTETFFFPIQTNSFHDLTLIRALITDGVSSPAAQRVWRLSKRLTTAQLSALQTFFEVTALGGLKPFYFYPSYGDYDVTGASVTGRVTVYFRGNWAHSVTLGRSDVPELILVEAA